MDERMLAECGEDQGEFNALVQGQDEEKGAHLQAWTPLPLDLRGARGALLRCPILPAGTVDDNRRMGQKKCQAGMVRP